MKRLATRVLDRLRLAVYRAQAEDPRPVKPTIVRPRPSDQALGDATTNRHATMNSPPPSRSPEAVAAQVSEVRGETKGAPGDTTGDRMPRSLGEVLARVLERLGESDPTRARIGLTVMVSGKIGNDGRERFPRRARRRRGQQEWMR